MTRKYRQLNPKMVYAASTLIIATLLTALAMPVGDTRRIMIAVGAAGAVVLLAVCAGIGSSQAEGLTARITAGDCQARVLEDGQRVTRARLAKVEADFAEHLEACHCQVPSYLERVLQRVPSDWGA
jgi:hypothetical protein